MGEHNENRLSRRSLLRKGIASSGGLALGATALSGNTTAASYSWAKSCYYAGRVLVLSFKVTDLGANTETGTKILSWEWELNATTTVGCENKAGKQPPGHKQQVPLKWNIGPVGKTTVEGNTSQEIARSAVLSVDTDSVDCPEGLSPTGITDITGYVTTNVTIKYEDGSTEELVQDAQIYECG